MKDKPKRLQDVSYFSQLDELKTNTLEVDTNVNEDKNRERLMDQSLDSFLKEIEESEKEDQQQ